MWGLVCVLFSSLAFYVSPPAKLNGSALTINNPTNITQSYKKCLQPHTHTHLWTHMYCTRIHTREFTCTLPHVTLYSELHESVHYSQDQATAPAWLQCTEQLCSDTDERRYSCLTFFHLNTLTPDPGTYTINWHDKGQMDLLPGVLS